MLSLNNLFLFHFFQFNEYIKVPEGDDINVSAHAAFLSWWNAKQRIPRVVVRIVQQTEGKKKYRGGSYHNDFHIPDINQPTRNDYPGTGFHQGHFCPAGDCTEEVMSATTNYRTNLAPQRPLTNWGGVHKLEHYFREVANNTPHQVIVFAFSIV